MYPTDTFANCIIDDCNFVCIFLIYHLTLG